MCEEAAAWDADPFDALYQGFSILTRKIALEERSRADVLIAPALPEHDEMSSATIAALMDAGESAANRALPTLRAIFTRAA